MKRILLKISLCVALLIGCVGFSPIIAIAETAENSAVNANAEDLSREEGISENSAEIVGETETSEWFDEVLMPLIIEYGSEVLAFVTVVLIALKDLNKTKSTLGTALGALTQSNTDNSSTVKAVEELKADFKVQKEEMQKQIKEQGTLFAEALKELKDSLGDKVEDTDDIVHKLLEVEKLAYGDNAALVSSGTAKRIAEVVDNGKAKDEK